MVGGRMIRTGRRQGHGREPAWRLAAGVFLALCTIGLPGTAVASHSSGGDGSRDFASGSASNEFAFVVGDAHLSVGAQSEPNGANPRGHVIARGDPDGPALPGEQFLVEGEVTCIDVRTVDSDTTRAAIKYRFERAEGSAEPFEGGGVQIFLEDNGEPQQGEPDRTTFDNPQTNAQFNPPAGNPSQCDNPNSRTTYDDIESGNYTVHDAPAGSGTSVPASEGAVPNLPEAGVEVPQDDGEPSEDESSDSGGDVEDNVEEVLEGLTP